MPRSFVTGSFIRMAPGAFNGVPFTYGAMAAIVYWGGTNSDYQEIMGPHAGAGPGVYFGIDDSNRWNCSYNGGSTNSALTGAVTGSEWYCVILTKATGTATPRFHIYRYSTNAWTHGNGNATMPNGSQNITNIDIGRYATGFEYWQGDIAVAGMYRTWVPTDAECEESGLPFSLTGWYIASARADLEAIWLLDQDATTTLVIDRTGGGANYSSQSGTPPAVSARAVPLFTYGADITEDVTVAGGGDSTADLGTATGTVTANNLSVATTLGTATITTTVAAPADALSTFAATAALAANLAGTGRTPLVALAATLANVLGYTDTVSVTAAALTLSAANLADALTPTTATFALVANTLAGSGQATQAATATLTASNPSGTRTSATANATTLANPLAFTAATALQTATSVTVTASPLAWISVTELAATATFTANGASLGATIATANLATLALNLSYTAQPTLAAATVSFAANGLALTPTSTLGSATSSLTANGLAVAATQTAATATVTAARLSGALTPTVANATTLANPLTQTRTAAAAQATATFAAYNLNNQVPGTATAAAAAALVTAYQITPLTLVSALTPTAPFTAAQLTATDRSQPAATGPFTAAPLVGTDRQASTTVINITGHNLAGLYTPQATLATVNLVAYNLANAAATAQVFRDWVQANVRRNQIAANVHTQAAIEAFVHQ